MRAHCCWGTRGSGVKSDWRTPKYTNAVPITARSCLMNLMRLIVAVHFRTVTFVGGQNDPLRSDRMVGFAFTVSKLPLEVRFGHSLALTGLPATCRCRDSSAAGSLQVASRSAAPVDPDVTAGELREWIMTGLFQDVRYTLRQLCKNPGFAGVSILTF